MELDKEKLKFELMDCFSEETWDKYDFEKLINNIVEDTDFLIVKGSNFRALFSKEDFELVNFDVSEVSSL